MISQIGFISLFLGLSFSLLIFLFSLLDVNNNSVRIDKKIPKLIFFQFCSVIFAFSFLIFAFLVSDFSNETVYNNSHSTKPLFYKITGVWGNHEGSLLLWLLVLTSFVLFFAIKSKNEPKNFRLHTILFHQIITIGFFIFVLKTSSPFNLIFPVPSEGLGLNPILQDPALGIHPPILYVGYVGTSIVL